MFLSLLRLLSSPDTSNDAACIIPNPFSISSLSIDRFFLFQTQDFIFKSPALPYAVFFSRNSFFSLLFYVGGGMQNVVALIIGRVETPLRNFIFSFNPLSIGYRRNLI